MMLLILVWLPLNDMLMQIMNGFQAMQGFLRVFGVEGPNGLFEIQVLTVQPFYFIASL